ncbi:MAG: hypothetical protein HC900_07100 [Methylacidiphilales bacterium]|nr:hypothetical protein [Candidatus Methylacidiphilales bacterium]
MTVPTALGPAATWVVLVLGLASITLDDELLVGNDPAPCPLKVAVQEPVFAPQCNNPLWMVRNTRKVQ